MEPDLTGITMDGREWRAVWVAADEGNSKPSPEWEVTVDGHLIGSIPDLGHGQPRGITAALVKRFLKEHGVIPA